MRYYGSSDDMHLYGVCQGRCCIAHRCHPPMKRFSDILLDHGSGRGGEKITVKTRHRRTMTDDMCIRVLMRQRKTDGKSGDAGVPALVLCT